MSEDTIEAYQQALQTLESARQKAEGSAQTIVHAATLLQDWTNVRVSNVDVAFPVQIPPNRSINADYWPSARQLAEALAAHHHALSEAGNAYRKIPIDQRQVVKPPPTR